MKIYLHYILFILVIPAYGQRYEYVYRNPSDSAVNCYLMVFPSHKEIKGLIIRDYSALPDFKKPSRSKLYKMAADSGLMTLYTVTSKFFPEMYYAEPEMRLLDEIVEEVIIKYHIPRSKIIMGGISASGTKALRYAQFCEQGKSKTGIRLQGVFAVDSPLDLARFYNSVKHHKAYFKAGMLWEAEHMPKVFAEKFKGSPEEFPQQYLEASVFSHTQPEQSNARFLKDLPIVLFHEPDIDWWLNERGSVYYDFNSYDIAAFVRTLKHMGSDKVTLITTSGKGFDTEGNRNCHSWSIVDENYLMKWIMEQMN
ncbi:MAG: hypothetical protein WC760_08895 [Bacteroidia bacterium]|jgi:hypothetical protein